MSPRSRASGLPARLSTPLALAALALALAGPARAQRVAASYDSVLAELRRLAPRADRSAAVRDFVLRRDVAEFRLDAGRLWLLTDVAGRTIGLAFVGRGDFAFRPPTAVERANLRRVLGDTALDTTITAAVFLFTDSTLARLQQRAAFEPAPLEGGVADRVNDALDFLVDGRYKAAPAGLMDALLNGTEPGWFAAYVKRERGEDLMVRIDPSQAEEIRLLRRGHLDGQRTETVCAFQREAEVRSGTLAASETPDPLRVAEYRIDSRLGGNYEYTARTVARLAARRDAGPWLRFDLFPELRVDSVLDEGGALLPFWRTDDNSDFWVRLPAPLLEGTSRLLTFVYHGRVVAFGGSPGLGVRWAYILSTGSWFPRFGAREAAAMDLTYHVPRSMRFASVGRLLDTRTEGNLTVTHWVTERPTRVAMFNVGDLDTMPVTDPRIPPTTILYNREAHAAIRHRLPSAFPGEEWLRHDIASSLAFFTERFGPPPPFQHYWVTEIPFAHGEAFPGLIHLAMNTFLGVSTTGGAESFRSHEIAHQWWGIGVEPATYRDWWLAEGFAEFSGLWYMQMALMNNDNYFRALRSSREELFRQKDRLPPISLGARASENPADGYALLVYDKGAWVLQMLRNMMLDLRTMSDSAFSATLRDWYATYDGRRVTTDDFRRVVERHVGAPMDWFFREWVDGTALPTYVWSWRSERQGDGRFLVRLRVRQEDVPADFEMDVPLRIVLPDSGEAFVRITVKGPLTETQFALPLEPRRLELNPLESVLAEVREERWR